MDGWTSILGDIIGRRAGWWVAANAIRDVASLVNADVINIHFGWELHVLEVLRLEGSFDEYRQIEIRHHHNRTHEPFPS